MNTWRDKAIHTILVGAASTSILIVLLIFVFLGKEAFPFIWEVGFGELFRTKWIPVSFKAEIFGLIPLISGSLLVTGFATLIMIPFGVFGAIYIAELGTETERSFLKPFIEILAGIPSVVIGFFGLVVLSPIIKSAFGLNTGLTGLTGAILLAFMAIPTVITVSEDAIQSVPRAYREASLALGASKLQTIFRVIVPAALPGIIAAIMLGMGRVIGETMAVLMVTGNAAKLTLNPFDSVRTMTATIAAEMGEVAFGSHHYQALFWVGIFLLIMTFGLNVVAQKVLRKYQMR
ncbi:MAG: phosphate ABC transporter permease subunit PstC [FCB group bacterium]|nr:phosphate ABC transporter permease subunit PstC [FCB group bacterium]MBL7120830.1 phosphate ABC transporter permease subunit PstC [Candidatus Neomarinimicrobiota bacterium]